MSAVLEPTVVQLVELLTEEADLYDQLLQLGDEERGAVVGNDPARLSSLVAEKESRVLRIARVETERQAWIEAWTAARGLAPSITLAELARHLPPLDAARVGAVRERLLARVRAVAEMNHRNSHLIGSALRIVNRSIETYSRFGSDAGYRATGAPTQGSRTMVLDRRV